MPISESTCHAPHLPHCVWHAISQLIYDDDTHPASVLAKRAALMLVCKEVGAATRGVPVQLDLRGAGDAATVKALLTRGPPVSRLWLRYDMRGDEILRDEGMRARSCTSLRELWASISCTDTLQPFRSLQLLHLQAYVLPRLYPAVLWGVTGLRRLTLHHYSDFCLTELPAALVPSIKFLEVTPKPVALHSHFALRLPAGMALDRLEVHGSFNEILSHKAAPRVTVDLAAMCQQIREVVLEAEDVIFELGRVRPGPGGGPAAAGVAGFAEALLASCQGPACQQTTAWLRLEFRVLGGIALVPPQGCSGASQRPQAAGGAWAGAGGWESDEGEGGEGGGPGGAGRLMSPERFAAELRQALLGAAGEGAVRVGVRRERCSIFEPAVLLIERV